MRVQRAQELVQHAPQRDIFTRVHELFTRAEQICETYCKEPITTLVPEYPKIKEITLWTAGEKTIAYDLQGAQESQWELNRNPKNNNIRIKRDGYIQHARVVARNSRIPIEQDVNRILQNG